MMVVALVSNTGLVVLGTDVAVTDEKDRRRWGRAGRRVGKARVHPHELKLVAAGGRNRFKNLRLVLASFSKR